MMNEDALPNLIKSFLKNGWAIHTNVDDSLYVLDEDGECFDIPPSSYVATRKYQTEDIWAIVAFYPTYGNMQQITKETWDEIKKILKPYKEHEHGTDVSDS
jgi:hypothetical protein